MSSAAPLAIVSLLVASSSAFSLAPLRMSADHAPSRRALLQDAVKTGLASAAVLRLSSAPAFAIDRPAAKALFFRCFGRVAGCNSQEVSRTNANAISDTRPGSRLAAGGFPAISSVPLTPASGTA
eukprot:scaffold5438_cov237-Pinguiococcus_pyrenoidosus.AAC.2